MKFFTSGPVVGTVCFFFHYAYCPASSLGQKTLHIFSGSVAKVICGIAHLILRPHWSYNGSDCEASEVITNIIDKFVLQYVS